MFTYTIKQKEKKKDKQAIYVWTTAQGAMGCSSVVVWLTSLAVDYNVQLLIGRWVVCHDGLPVIAHFGVLVYAAGGYQLDDDRHVPVQEMKERRQKKSWH